VSDDRVALVTGASSGIGAATVRRLVRRGYRVAAVARRGDRLQALADESDGAVLPIVADVTDEAQARDAVSLTVADAGGLDVLVNNAGISGEQRPVADASMADLRRVLETNVIGAATVLATFTPLLDASAAPVVVNVSSAVGSLTLNARPDAAWSMVAYPVSKAALNMLTIQYARAFPRWRVNSATPGLTATDFAPSAARGHSVAEGAEILVQMATIGPDGPTGTFVDINGAVPW
jgi:NAD(P)-dependent dehydrogenase (short-subunit alcohol dehydrogenase family)